MAVKVIKPVNLAVGTGLVDVGNAATPAIVPDGKERVVDVRAGCKSAIDAVVSGLFLVDTAVAGNQANRAPNVPVPFNSEKSAVDLERQLLIPAGFKLQAQAGALDSVWISMTGIERDAEA